MRKWSEITNNWKRFRKNRLFFRILFYFISLLIPIVIIGIVFYYNSVNLLKRELLEKVSLNIASSIRTIDVYLRTEEQMESGLFYNFTVRQNLNSYSQMTLDQKVNMGNLVNILSSSNNIVSPFTDNIFMYIDDQIVYRSEGTDNIDFFLLHVYKFDNYDPQFWKNMLHSQETFKILPPSKVVNEFQNTSKWVIPIVKTQYVNGNIAVIVANISVETIRQALARNLTYSDTNFFVVDTNNNLIASGSKELDSSTIRQVRDYFGHQSQASGTITINGIAYISTMNVSPDYNWTYYSLTPHSVAERHADNILSLTFLICLVLLLIGAVFSFLFSVNLYNPIKNMREILLNEGSNLHILEDETKNRNEFEIIGMGINRLLEKQQQANQKFIRFSSEYLDNMLMHLLQGTQLVHEEALLTMLEEMGFEGELYICCCVQFQFNDSFYREISDVDRLMILSKLKNVILGLLGRDVTSYLIESTQNLYIAVVDLKNKEERFYLDLALQRILKTFEYDFKYCSLRIGIGQACGNLHDLMKSYDEAMTAIDSIPDNRDFMIVDAANLPMGENFYYSLMDENKVINGLKMGDPDLLWNQVLAIVRSNREKGISLHSTGMLFVQLYNTGNRYLADKGMHIFDIISEKQHYELSAGMHSPGQMPNRLEQLRSFYARIMELTANQEEPRNDSAVRVIMDYIHQHYRGNLYLDKIAEEMGMSAKYISRLFKEKTKINLSDYISMTRLDEAKKQLAHTDLKINQIADQVGIPSRVTFLRLFKKYEGISPHDYRQLIKKQNTNEHKR